MKQSEGNDDEGAVYIPIVVGGLMQAVAGFLILIRTKRDPRKIAEGILVV